MKYKAIKVDDYWVIVSDETPMRYSWVYSTVTNSIFQVMATFSDEMKVVIATSKKIGELPLFDVPGEWENNDYDLTQDLIILCEAWMRAKFPHYVDASYLLIKEVIMPKVNKAKEKYQFTLEDMENAVEFGARQCKKYDYIDLQEQSEFIESLTKPKQYEVEIEQDCTLVGLGLEESCKPKITEGKVKINNWKEL